MNYPFIWNQSTKIVIFGNIQNNSFLGRSRMNISGGFFTRRLRRDAAGAGDNELIARLLLRSCFCVYIFLYDAMKYVCFWTLQRHNTFFPDIFDSWKCSLRLFFIMFETILSFLFWPPFFKFESCTKWSLNFFLVYKTISFQSARLKCDEFYFVLHYSEFCFAS